MELICNLFSSNMQGNLSKRQKTRNTLILKNQLMSNIDDYFSVRQQHETEPSVAHSSTRGLLGTQSACFGGDSHARKAPP